MKASLKGAIVLAISSTAVHAQVINGESTYDDNYIHTPPAGSASNLGAPRPATQVPTAAQPTTSAGSTPATSDRHD